MVDDHTFTIKTTEPVSNLPVRLGYTAFAPLPDAFFDDPKAFEKKPIGAGPYEVTKYEPGKSAELKHFADYGGDGPKGNVDKITFRFYDDDRGRLQRPARRQPGRARRHCPRAHWWARSTSRTSASVGTRRPTRRIQAISVPPGRT